MKVHERIKARRKEVGLSAEDVAEALGVSRATVYRYESAEIDKLPITIIEPLAKVLRCPISHLMGWEEVKIDSTPEPDLYSDEVLKIAQFISDNPDLKELFQELYDASQQIHKEDMPFLKEMIGRLSK